jgi:SNF2 family DNA or RNA helicase
MVYKFKRKPRTYQLAALKKALELDNAMALWFDPGLGKTKVAIDFSAIKYLKEGAKKVLIVCPLSAIGVWDEELELDYPSEFMTVPIVGDMKDRIKTVDGVLHTPLNCQTFMIINYDSLRNDKILGMVKKWKPQILLIDEMHYCKNPTTQRSKAVYYIRKKAKWVMGLTGTPIPKNPLDIFSQYKILDSSIFGTNFKDFKNEYSIPHPIFPKKVKDWKNLKDMAKKIHTIAYRMRDEECKTLPPLIIRDIPVYLSKKTQKVYKQMADEMIAELDNLEVVTAKIAMTKVGKLQQIAGGFIQRIDKSLVDGKVKKQRVTFPVGSEKLDVFMDLVDRYIDNHKILVGCQYLWEIRQIELRLEKRGVSYVTIKGGVDGDARTAAKIKFQSDPVCRVIIFQVAAATAMTLTAGDIGILYSCTRKWDHYWQWLKRIHREGQTKPVYILRLISKGTVDRDIVEGLAEKRKFTDSVIDRSQYRNMLKPKF